MDTLLQLMESYGYVAMFVAMVLENANIPGRLFILDDLPHCLCSRPRRFNLKLLARLLWWTPIIIEIR